MSVEALQFLKELNSGILDEPLKRGGVVCCTGGVYSASYPLHMLKLFKSRGFAVNFVGKDANDVSSLQSRLSISFLGQSNLFWLGDLAEYDSATRTALLKFLSAYRGPHLVLFFSSDAALKTDTYVYHVTLGATVDRSACRVLWLLLWPNKSIPPWADRALATLFADINLLPFDAAYLLFNYVVLLGESTFDQIDSWRGLLVAQEQSLYLLAGHLFSCSAASFFEQWVFYKELYPDQFWISFWSDQLFRAYWFVYYQQSSQREEMRKISQKLPFSFTKKDYKKHSLCALQAAHHLLYVIDGGLKNGQEIGLELFFAKFFADVTH